MSGVMTPGYWTAPAEIAGSFGGTVIPDRSCLSGGDPGGGGGAAAAAETAGVRGRPLSAPGSAKPTAAPAPAVRRRSRNCLRPIREVGSERFINGPPACVLAWRSYRYVGRAA